MVIEDMSSANLLDIDRITILWSSPYSCHKQNNCIYLEPLPDIGL